MCGIAGIFCLESQLSQCLPNIQLMARSMKSRGPDDEGYLVASKNIRPVKIFSGKDTPVSQHSVPFYPTCDVKSANEFPGHLFFAHRRLSIIDLSSSGHQPMCDDSKRYWIIYNGEIYNYKEIAKELNYLGIKFIGSSDTEVLLYAYREWGIAVLKKINGMFAFAIWDDKRKELFCARDRIGIKPFYYTIQNSRFVFASDIKTIIASGLYNPAVNLEGLYHTLSFGVAPRPITCFKNIYALEPGHWMRINSKGNFEKQRYWQLSVGMQKLTMSEDEAIGLLHEKLTKAVNRRLVADVPIGTFMSGGIDSTTVSAIAAQLHPGIKAFTIAFESDDEEFNELSQAKATAEMYQMKHITQTVKPEDIIDHINIMIRCYEEPYYSLSPNYIISKLAANNGVKVILNGLGGDELFGGYRYYSWANKWKILSMLKCVAGALRNLSPRVERLYAILSAKSADRLHTTLSSIQTEHSKQTLFRDAAAKGFNSIDKLHELYVGKDKHFHDIVEAFNYMDIINYIGNHHVYRIDQFTMNFSIEGRFPFLDHELIEAAFQIPTKYKINGKVQKYVLRKVAEKLIHPSCLKMKKMGFCVPVGFWMRRGPLKALTEKKLDLLKQRDLFNADEINRRYDKFLTGKYQFRPIWQLVAVELWLETFIDNGIIS